MDRVFSRLINLSSESTMRPKLMSQIFHFPEAIPKEKKLKNLSPSKSFKLMMTQGYIKPINPGIFSLMPLALRCLEKLNFLVDQLMLKVQAQKVLFPTLIQETFMKTSGRWENNTNLFKFKDRHSSSYCLGPTHEEIASSMFSKLRISYKALPLRLYQISTKFRDEMNPKLGLLRGREFVMKDMYTFDSSEETAKATYEDMCNIYQELFHLLGVEAVKVKGASGDIGGDLSHEFHIVSDVGEDIILYCPNCKSGINSELCNEENLKCSTCNTAYVKENAIEVGHGFLLGTTYSKPFQAEYNDMDSKNKYLEMGCYGLGITRIIAASLEHLSTEDNIRLPLLITPYLLSVIIPKKGSKEESVVPFAEDLIATLCKIDWLKSNVVLDDRINLTIGKRVQEANAIGIPFIVVVGGLALKTVPKVEVINVYESETLYLTHMETIQYFKSKNYSFNVS